MMHIFRKFRVIRIRVLINIHTVIIYSSACMLFLFVALSKLLINVNQLLSIDSNKSFKNMNIENVFTWIEYVRIIHAH